MNIYLLEQNAVTGVDTFDSCVVCAESEQEARMIDPSCGIKEYTPPWCKPEDVKVTLIGMAKPFMNAGIVCASFNAG